MKNLQLNKRYLIPDTCIIQFSGSSKKNESEAFLNCFTKLTKEKYSLAISEFTVYENLHGLWGNKAKVASNELTKYEWKIISADVLKMAAILGGLYHEEKYDGIGSGDKIIAATAILEKGFVLTANHRHFPPPIFFTMQSLPVSYKVGHYELTRDLAIYEPHYSLINRRIGEKNKS